MKQSKTFTQQPKNFENSNILYIKSVTIEHSQTFRKLSKATRHPEKVSQVVSDSPLYNKTKKIIFKKCNNNKAISSL